MNGQDQILFIVNKNSGTNDNQNFPDILNQYPNIKPENITVYTMTGEDDVVRIKKIIEDFKPIKVVAVGGDGTVNLVASFLINKNIKLGIIPSGSANGMAYELGIPSGMSDALDVIFSDHTRKIDIVRINNEHISLHLCDVGLNARIVKNFEEEGGRGLNQYAKHLIKELFKSEKSFYVKIASEKLTVRIKAVMVVIANSTKYGTGAIINPAGDLSDGRFELIVLRPHPFWFLIKMVFIMFTGTIHRQRFVKVYSLKKTEIILSEPHELQIDGEVQGKHQRIEAESVPGAVEVLVP